MRGQTRKRLGRLERLGRLGRIDGGCVFFAEALPGPHLMDGHGAQVKRPTVGLSSVGERIHSANAPKTTTWARFTTARKSSSATSGPKPGWMRRRNSLSVSGAAGRRPG